MHQTTYLNACERQKIGLRREMFSHQPTYPNASRTTKNRPMDGLWVLSTRRFQRESWLHHLRRQGDRETLRQRAEPADAGEEVDAPRRNLRRKRDETLLRPGSEGRNQRERQDGYHRESRYRLSVLARSVRIGFPCECTKQRILTLANDKKSGYAERCSATNQPIRTPREQQKHEIGRRGLQPRLRHLTFYRAYGRCHYCLTMAQTSCISSMTGPCQFCTSGLCAS